MKDKRTLLSTILIVFAVLVLNGCKSTEVVTAPPSPPSQPIQVSGTELDPYNMSKIRSSEAVHAYYLGPYIDPRDSRIRHDGHRITRIEQEPEWNLTPSAPTAVPLGPVVAIADPAKQVAPLSAELESKIAQANTLIAALIEQNDKLQSQLQEKDKAIEALSQRISKIEKK